MKKSFMNIKNFVDSNVRQRIDRVAHNNHEALNDDLLLAERHFDDIRHTCIDAEKKISAMLQSIQSSSNQSHIGTYTQNVQVGLNNFSHNMGLNSNALSNSSATINTCIKTSEANSQRVQTSRVDLDSSHSNTIVQKQPLDTQQYNSNDSLSSRNSTPTGTGQISSKTSVDMNHLSGQLSSDIQQKHKKLPSVVFYKFLVKSSQRLKQNSLLSSVLSQSSQIQIHLTNLYLSYEQLIEAQCLKPIRQMLEVDIPNVIKLKKLFSKSHNDYESLRSKYHAAYVKQQNQSIQSAHFTSTSYLITQTNIQLQSTNKLDQLRNELDDALLRSEQSKDSYETELYGFLCREFELATLLKMFYQYQTEYHSKVATVLQELVPNLGFMLALTPKKFAFGTKLEEHLHCTGRVLAPVIELCVHFLHSQGLNEEGLFRIPGSSLKIKKLKNAINAWFISPNLVEGSNENPKTLQPGQSCLVALFAIFKSAVGQKNRKHHLRQCANLTVSSQLKGAIAADVSAINQTNLPTETTDYDEEILLDVHSIAGLLKLYLRELPEPLFTFALYNQWIDCVNLDKKSPNECQLDDLSKVISKLPTASYANLKHLLKFLQLLTLHQERNKMTSTNLAIAMAPSLIWASPVGTELNINDDTSSLKTQISSFGVSASLHAMVLEALIKNADSLFPEPSDFSLPECTDFTLISRKDRHPTRSRSVKSTSPTGISTASSSSFSSNNSTSSFVTKDHDRKEGSMERLSNDQDVTSDPNQSNKNSSIQGVSRPVSVCVQSDQHCSLDMRNERLVGERPLKPPVPSARSRSKHTSMDRDTKQTALNSSHKPQAPPVPPSLGTKNQLERIISEDSVSENLSGEGVNLQASKPRPTSLRGTGTIGQATKTSATISGGNQLVARPNVPPPERPKSASIAITEDAGCPSEVQQSTTIPITDNITSQL